MIQPVVVFPVKHHQIARLRLVSRLDIHVCAQILQFLLHLHAVVAEREILLLHIDVVQAEGYEHRTPLGVFQTEPVAVAGIIAAHSVLVIDVVALVGLISYLRLREGQQVGTPVAGQADGGSHLLPFAFPFLLVDRCFQAGMRHAGRAGRIRHADRQLMHAVCSRSIAGREIAGLFAGALISYIGAVHRVQRNRVRRGAAADAYVHGDCIALRHRVAAAQAHAYIQLRRGLLRGSGSRFSSGLSGGFRSRLDSGFLGCLNSGLLSRLDSGFLGCLNSRLLSRLDSGFLGCLNSRLLSRLDSRFLGRLNSGLRSRLNSGLLGCLNRLLRRRSSGGFGRRGLSRGDLSRRSLGRRDLSRRSLGRGDLSRRSLGRGDLSRGDLSRRSLGRRGLGHGRRRFLHSLRKGSGHGHHQRSYHHQAEQQRQKFAFHSFPSSIQASGQPAAVSALSPLFLACTACIVTLIIVFASMYSLPSATPKCTFVNSGLVFSPGLSVLL